MSKLRIPISDRARKYGYLYWTADLDEEVEQLLGDSTSVNLIFDKAQHGKKNVDWKNRRISIGWRWTRLLPQDVSNFELTLEGRTLNVICR